MSKGKLLYERVRETAGRTTKKGFGGVVGRGNFESEVSHL